MKRISQKIVHTSWNEWSNMLNEGEVGIVRYHALVHHT